MKLDQHKRLHALFTSIACAGFLASCAAPPVPSAVPTPAKPVSAPAPAAPVEAAAVAAPEATPPAVAAVPAAPAQTPVTPVTMQNAQRQATSAIDMLEAGQEEQALAELQRALQGDPNNRLAQSLLRQIQADPVAVLGRESFPYRVQPGESLSKIAQRFMGDLYQFYILARYNDIRVPRQVQAGQMIKVPGKAPAGAAGAAGAAAPSLVTAPTPAPAAAAAPAVDPAKAERERQAKVAAATRAAKAAYARQDLLRAIRNWDIVLELDPSNDGAKIERQRAIDLKAKLDKLPK